MNKEKNNKDSEFSFKLFKGSTYACFQCSKLCFVSLVQLLKQEA